MPLQSDVTLDVSKFGSRAISEQTNKFNDKLERLTRDGPNWWDVGAPKYRQMRWAGETPFGKPQVLNSGVNIKLPSRESGREIPCRVFQPEGGKPSGVFYHIHGGGWVLNSEAFQDGMLKRYADSGNLVVVSVGYRLAPEDPYPAGNEDCVDVGHYLVDNAEKDYGAPLKFMGGESAGGHLAVVTCYSLLETTPKFAFKGLVLNFGVFNLAAFLPMVYTFEQPLLLTRAIMDNYITYVPNTTVEQRRNPMISPIFADMESMKLPSTLFTCGTTDPLLDDNLLMHAKWAASGAESILKIYPGGAHGFVFFAPGSTETTEQSLDDIVTFINERI